MKTLRNELQDVVAQAQAILATATREDRTTTEEERGQVETLTAKAKEIQAQIARAEGDDALRAQIAAMAPAHVTPPADRGPAPKGKASIGEQFLASDAYRFLRDRRHVGAARWSTPAVELAATLTSDAASGGDLILPQYRAGVVPLMTQPPTVADLFAQGTTGSNLISYMKETTFTNAAAAVTEGEAKPESTLVFDAVTDAVRKIAHWLPVTDEMLEDVQGLRSYIDERLILGVRQAEDAQLLTGDGTAPNISGILDRANLATAVARGSDTNADAILKQIMAIRTAAFVQPDAIVMHPANWQAIVLAKDAQGQYYGNGPFSSVVTPQLWGLPVVLTTNMTQNTALVGAFRSAAQIFRRSGIMVEVSNSHSDFFVKNLTAIRAEERLALAVYRPGAFGTVTGLV